MSLRESAGFIPSSEARVRGSMDVMIQLTDAAHRRAVQPRRGLIKSEKEAEGADEEPRRGPS